MAVLLEAYNLVVRNAALDERYPGGTRVFCDESPRVSCTDGRLTRVGFMSYDDARREAMRLVSLGTLALVGDGFDRAVIISERDAQVPDWLEVGVRSDRRAAWARGREPGAVEVPEGWSASSLEFVGPNEAQYLEFVSADDGVETYRDVRTGRTVYTSRTPGAPRHLDAQQAQALEAVRRKASSILLPYLPLAEGARKRADSFFARRKVKKALAMLDDVIAAAPDLFANHWIRGMALRALGDAEGSARSLGKAFELEPANADVAREYCAACLALGAGDEAVRVARHNLALHPDDAGLRANLALALLVAGDVRGASLEVQAAVDCAPADPISLRLLALIRSVEAGERPCPDRYPF